MGCPTAEADGKDDEENNSLVLSYLASCEAHPRRGEEYPFFSYCLSEILSEITPVYFVQNSFDYNNSVNWFLRNS